MGLVREFRKAAGKAYDATIGQVVGPNSITGKLYDIAGEAVESVGSFVEKTANSLSTKIEAIVDDPKKMAALAVSIYAPQLAGQLGSYLGAGAANAAASQIVGQTIINASLNGGDVEAALKGAAVPILGQQAGLEFAKSLDLDPETQKSFFNVAKAAGGSAASAAILGKDPIAAFALGGANAAMSATLAQIPNFSGLNPTNQAIIASGLVASLRGVDPSSAIANSLINAAVQEAKVQYKSREIGQLIGGKDADYGYGDIKSPELRAALDESDDPINDPKVAQLTNFYKDNYEGISSGFKSNEDMQNSYAQGIWSPTKYYQNQKYEEEGWTYDPTDGSWFKTSTNVAEAPEDTTQQIIDAFQNAQTPTDQGAQVADAMRAGDPGSGTYFDSQGRLVVSDTTPDTTLEKILAGPADDTAQKDREARQAGFPDYATQQKWGGDWVAFSADRDEQNVREAGWPDFATWQRYGGDMAAYQTDQEKASAPTPQPEPAPAPAPAPTPDVVKQLEEAGLQSNTPAPTPAPTTTPEPAPTPAPTPAPSSDVVKQLEEAGLQPAPAPTPQPAPAPAPAPEPAPAPDVVKQLEEAGLQPAPAPETSKPNVQAQTTDDGTTTGVQDVIKQITADTTQTQQPLANQTSGQTTDQTANQTADQTGGQTAATDQALAGLGTQIGDLNTRINDLVSQGVSQQDATTQAINELQTGQTELQQQLTQTQKNLIDQLQAAGVSYQDALNTAISATREDLTGTIDTRTQEILNQLSGTKTDLQDLISQNQSSTEQSLTGLGQNVSDLNTRVNELMAQGSSYQDATTQAINELQAGQEGLQQQLTDNQKALVDQLQAAGLSYQDALETAIAATREDLTGTIDARTQELLDQLAGTKTNLEDLISGNQSKTDQSLTDLQQQLTDSQKNLMDQLQAAGMSYQDALNTAIAATREDLTGTIDARTQDILDQLAGTKTGLEDLINQNQTATEEALAGYGTSLAESQKWTEGQSAGLRDTLDENQKATFDAMTSMGANIEDAFNTALAEQGTQLQGQIDKTTQQLIDELAGTKTGLESKIDTTQTGLKNEISGVKSGLTGQISDVKNQLTSAQKSQDIQGNLLQALSVIGLGGSAQAPIAPQPIPVVGESAGLDLSQPLDVALFGRAAKQKNAQNQPGTTKISTGGYLDDLLDAIK